MLFFLTYFNQRERNYLDCLRVQFQFLSLIEAIETKSLAICCTNFVYRREFEESFKNIVTQCNAKTIIAKNNVHVAVLFF